MSRTWSLMHPADIAQTKAEILARQRESARGTAMCASNRVYDALNVDTGFDNRQGPMAPAIVWDKSQGRYRRFTQAEFEMQTRKVVHSQTRRPQAGNRQSGGSAR